MDLELDDALIVLAGATSGIGNAVATLLEQEQARMVFVGGREEGLAALTARLRKGTVLESIPGDFRRSQDRQRCIEATNALQGISGFVFLSTELRTDSVCEARISEFRETFDVNFFSAFDLAQSILLHSAPGASLVFTSSIDARRHPIGTPSAAYDSSKKALESLSGSIAAECGPRHIRSNCIVPGLIRTPMTEDFFAPSFDQERRRFLAAVPLARAGTAAEVADLIVFLLSPRSSYITGTTIPVDGGFLCSGL